MDTKTTIPTSPTLEVTIQGLAFTLSPRFAEMHICSAGDAAVLHHAEVAVNFAILAAMMRSQKHARDYPTPARRFLEGWFPPQRFWTTKPRWQRRTAEKISKLMQNCRKVRRLG